jgi:hypothetical protein
MSYYVTLPSNGADLKSEHGILNNSQSDFEIELKVPLDFSYKEYEVALAEISFRKTWLINIGNFKIIDTIQKNIIKEVNIQVLDGITIKKLIYIINEHLKDYTPKNLLINKQYSNVTLSLFDDGKLEIHVPLGFNLEINGYFATLLRHRASTQQNYGQTWMEMERDKQIYAQNNVIISNKSKLTILGHERLSTKCHIVNNFLKYVEELFVYTNIIDDVHVGGEMLKLLKVVSVNAGFDEVFSEVFHTPHYLSLDSRFIDRIRLFICDSEGNKIRFTDEHSRVVYKLHFRPKYYK